MIELLIELLLNREFGGGQTLGSSLETLGSTPLDLQGGFNPSNLQLLQGAVAEEPLLQSRCCKAAAAKLLLS